MQALGTQNRAHLSCAQACIQNRAQALCSLCAQACIQNRAHPSCASLKQHIHFRLLPCLAVGDVFWVVDQHIHFGLLPGLAVGDVFWVVGKLWA